jgi:hypothetical protein
MPCTGMTVRPMTQAQDRGDVECAQVHNLAAAATTCRQARAAPPRHHLAFVLRTQPEGTTRLLVRERYAYTKR